MKARLLAHYLPQYHPIPENNRWWGPGFTEWTNTAKAHPLFAGHKLPNIPSDLGYYDLRVPETREEQANLARDYGIEGFVYWHYWFGDGKRLLERPYIEMVRSKKPDFPFCLAWANHTWSGIWHGSPDKILIEQKYPGEEDIKAHFYILLEGFKDHRYLKINGKNIFCIYRPTELQQPVRFMQIWRELAHKENAPDFHFIGITDYPWTLPEGEYDGFTTNPPVGQLPYQGVENINEKIRFSMNGYKGKLPQVYTYKQFMQHAFPRCTMNDKFYPCVMPNWDNTPRSGTNGFVLLDSTPSLYSEHLHEAISIVNDRSEQEKVIFVKSWNEWAEGNYLEPDLRHEKAYLEATLNALM